MIAYLHDYVEIFPILCAVHYKLFGYVFGPLSVTFTMATELSKEPLRIMMFYDWKSDSNSGDNHTR